MRFRATTHQRKVLLLAELEGVVGVLDLLHVAALCLPRWLVDALPVDEARLDLVEELDEDEAVAQVLVEVVDERVDAERVHPVAERLLVAVLLNLLELLDGDVGGQVERRVGVEHVGDEGEVELLVALDDVGRAHKLAAVDLLGLLQHALRALRLVGDAERGRVDAGPGGRDLLDQDRVALRVLDVLAEVGHPPRRAGGLEVVVEPAQQQLLRGQRHQRLQVLPALEQRRHAGHIGQVDASEQADLFKFKKRKKAVRRAGLKRAGRDEKGGNRE